MTIRSRRLSMEKPLIEGVDYQLGAVMNNQNTNVETAKVTFIEGEFKGVSLTIGTIKFNEEENDDGTITCDFNYEILDDNEIEDLRDSPQFTEYLSRFLESMLLTFVEAAEKNHGSDETGTDDITLADNE